MLNTIYTSLKAQIKEKLFVDNCVERDHKGYG